MPALIKKILAYQDLFLVFIWRDFNVKYRHAALGIAWAVIQPLAFMLLFSMIFTYIMPVKVTCAPFPVFFYTGLLPWTLFASSITYSINSITGNHALLQKIYFPRMILPLASICTAFVDYIIAFLLFLVLLGIYHIHLSLAALWYLPLLFLLLLFILAAALCLSVINVYYRDVGLASGFLIQLLFFSTPILYSIDRIAPHAKWLVFLNPLTFIIENMRRCVLEGRSVVPWQYGCMFIFLVLFLGLSFKFFKSMERKLTDVL